jgi:hypothetical protein
MGWWSSLFETDDAVWESAASPDQAIAAIANTYSSWRYRTIDEGSSLRVVPRRGGRGGGPVYAIQFEASPAGTGSRIDSHVEPFTRGVVKGIALSAAVAVVGLLLVFAGVELQFLVVLGALGILVSSIQLSLMGLVRKSVSKRLVGKMHVVGMYEAPGPGWYPDPTQPGKSRWWDGHDWSSPTSA